MPRASTVAAAAAVLLGAAPLSAACSGPTAGQNVSMFPCGQAGAAQAWNYTHVGPNLGVFSLRASPNLCMAIIGASPLSNTPLVGVSSCSSTPPQLWAIGFPGQPQTVIYSANDGNVLDVYDNVLAPGTSVDTFSPNGGANQAWTFSPNSGQLVTALDNFCLSVC